VEGRFPGHGDGSAGVGQSVAGFVFNRRLGDFLGHVGPVPSALDHEILNDPVKNRPVVKLGVDIRKEVGDGAGGFLRIELEGDIPLARFHHDRDRSGRGGRGRGQGEGEEDAGQAEERGEHRSHVNLLRDRAAGAGPKESGRRRESEKR